MAALSTPLSILSIFFVLNSIPIPSFSCPVHQQEALLRFKSTLTNIINSTSDPNSDNFIPFQELDTWNPKSSCCYWDLLGPCQVQQN
ncbi:hypothetical protein L2E82_48604 [Cichorium intybus]|uniref:Uncharacterized protein n=1 Tax=Cichorium intybus TaxID=13427 RepID=A0ACB8YYM8_CICIN|nr:hypothetical protein L2E82_48604 [Cichorium intybus]